MLKNDKIIYISAVKQELICYENDKPIFTYIVSTSKNGVGEKKNSECTPRGWHKVYSVIGRELPINSVLVSREWTNEIYSHELALQFPNRDWILSRIIQLDGLEPGRNQGGDVDSLERFIYIHGTPDSEPLGKPASHGCIRMKNSEVAKLANWATTETLVYIQ